MLGMAYRYEYPRNTTPDAQLTAMIEIVKARTAIFQAFLELAPRFPSLLLYLQKPFSSLN
jgi:hypothetical protein